MKKKFKIIGETKEEYILEVVAEDSDKISKSNCKVPKFILEED